MQALHAVWTASVRLPALHGRSRRTSRGDLVTQEWETGAHWDLWFSEWSPGPIPAAVAATSHWSSCNWWHADIGCQLMCWQLSVSHHLPFALDCLLDWLCGQVFGQSCLPFSFSLVLTVRGRWRRNRRTGNSRVNRTKTRVLQSMCVHSRSVSSGERLHLGVACFTETEEGGLNFILTGYALKHHHLNYQLARKYAIGRALIVHQASVSERTETREVKLLPVCKYFSRFLSHIWSRSSPAYDGDFLILCVASPLSLREMCIN